MMFTGKILLVDDEIHIRKFVALILKQLGRPVITEASNGEDALAAFKADRPDLVLLDVNMPRMDGIETLRHMKELDPDCTVIMLTSLANRESVERTLQLGADAYIRKDTPKEEISAALAEFLNPPSDPA